MTDGGSEMMLVRSTDGGRTWSEPSAIAAHNARFSDHTTAVGPDGALYLLYTLSSDDAYGIVLAVSHDGGEHLPRLNA